MKNWRQAPDGSLVAPDVNAEEAATAEMTYQEKQKQLFDEIRRKVASGGRIGSTVVEMAADFSSSPARFLSSVVFVPDSLQTALAERVIEPLRAIEPEHHYFRPEALHLTIKNVRNEANPPTFSDEDVRKVDELFQRVVPRHSRFSFDVRGTIAFPTSVSVTAFSDESLYRLVRELDDGLKEIGLPDDKKYLSDTVFFGNITVCRFTRPPSERFLEQVRALQEIEVGELAVERIALIVANVVLAPDALDIINTYDLNRV
jgi:2'-5' RNA ligase